MLAHPQTRRSIAGTIPADNPEMPNLNHSCSGGGFVTAIATLSPMTHVIVALALPCLGIPFIYRKFRFATAECGKSDVTPFILPLVSIWHTDCSSVWRGKFSV
jgi:hypothetical protein